MSNLEKAAQAVLVRWDSPAWDWAHQGPTAALMADLRRALAAHREQQAEPVPILPSPTACATCGEGPYFTAQQMREYAAALERAMPVVVQAEPVSAPPKSFRVGYMTGYADGQRELREKQQTGPLVGSSVMPPAAMLARRLFEAGESNEPT
jgi:hypothetical protein